MPDVQEVFRMSTQKVRQDPGAMERQRTRQRKAARNRKLGALTVVGGIVAAVIVAAVAGSDRSSEPGPLVAAEPGGPDLAYFTLDLTTGETSDSRPLPPQLIGASLYAISPNGQSVAYGTCCTPPNFISVVNLDGSNERRVTPDGIDAYGPSWSPDGLLLVYQGRDGATTELGDIFVVDVSTGKVERVTHLPRSFASGWSMHPSFTADGERIIFHMPRPDGAVSDLWSVDADGGEPTIVRRDALFGELWGEPGSALAYVEPIPDGGSALRVVYPSDEVQTVARGEEFGRARWSPEGSRIAYSEGDSLYVADLASGDVERVAGGAYGTWLSDGRLLVVG